MMNKILESYNQLLKERNYLAMFNLLNNATKEYLDQSSREHSYAQVLVELNIDLLEILGASKQYEMDFNMHSQLVRNRNSIFRTLLEDNPTTMILFDKIAKGAK